MTSSAGIWLDSSDNFVHQAPWLAATWLRSGLGQGGSSIECRYVCVCWNMTERSKGEINFLSYLVCLIKRLVDRSIQCFPLGQSRHKFAWTHTHTHIAALSASSNYWLNNKWKGRGMKIYHLCVHPINYSKKQLMKLSVFILYENIVLLITYLEFFRFMSLCTTVTVG